MKDNETKIFADDELNFLEESFNEEEITPETDDGADVWNILIVDDEEQVHAITKLAIKDIIFQRKKIRFHSVFSAEEAKVFLKSRDDISVILLDVIMENDRAGLDLVNFIRTELINNAVRIILRTGMPGMIPENDVILKYGINDYKTKSELTVQKLFTSIVSALRSYNDITIINRKKSEINRALIATKLLMNPLSLYGSCHTIIKAYHYLFNERENDFSYNDAIHSGFCGIVKDRKEKRIEILTGTGYFSEGCEIFPDAIFSGRKLELLIQTIEEKNETICNSFLCAFFSLSNFTELVICIDFQDINEFFDANILKIFAGSVKMSLETAALIDILDTKLREKNESLKDILNNSNQAFLSFGADFIINSDYSAKCFELFGKEINGMDVMDLIFQNSLLPNFDKSGDSDASENICIKKIFESCFSDKEKTHILFKLLPKEIIPNSTGKNLSAKYVYMPNSVRILIILGENIKKSV